MNEEQRLKVQNTLFIYLYYCILKLVSVAVAYRHQILTSYINKEQRLKYQSTLFHFEN